MPRTYKPQPKEERPCEYCGRLSLGNAKRRFCSEACRAGEHRLGLAIKSETPNLKMRFRVLKRDNFRCTYCGRGIENGIRLETDHVIPRAAGGLNRMDNLVTACHECNIGKGG